MPVGQGPHQHGSWSHSSRARGGRAGPEQGSQPQDGWAGTCGWAEAGLGCQPTAGGQGQEWGAGRLRSTCHLAQARPRVRAAASKQVLSEGPHLSQQLAHSSASWLRSWTPTQANSLRVGGRGEICTQEGFEMLRYYLLGFWSYGRKLWDNISRAKNQMPKPKVLSAKGQTTSIITYILHKLKFLRILKRRSIPSGHLSKEEFDAQFNNLGNKLHKMK